MNLAEEINKRLRAGALVVIVQEPDELLSVAAAQAGAKAFGKVKTLTALSENVDDTLEEFSRKPGQGTAIISDLLNVRSGNNSTLRAIREVALQAGCEAGEYDEFNHLILIEAPGIQIPPMLASDVEIIEPPMPDVAELADELDVFLEGHQVQATPKAKQELADYRHEIAASVAGLPRHEAARLYSRCWVDTGEQLDPVWLRKQKAERVSDRLGGALTFVNVDIPDAGGLESLKGWLSARRKAFGSEKAKEFGLPEPKGTLLLGPPGTGKSLTAKVVAKEWGFPLLRLDAGKLFGSLVGQSESQTRMAIQAAEACAPCVVWIDEIEKGLAGAMGQGDSGTSQRVFGTLLTWLQEKTAPVFVVATANDVSALPPELLRKGRFDEIWFVDLPTPEERAEILNIHLKRRHRDPEGFDVTSLVKETEGFNGAELEQAIVDALFHAFDEDREMVTEDILSAVRATSPLSKTMSERLDALRHWAATRTRPAAKKRKPKAAGNGDGSKVRRPKATLASKEAN